MTPGRPTLGQTVIYVRGQGEAFAGRITIVNPRRLLREIGYEEDGYDVFLAVDIHNPHHVNAGVRASGHVWFSTSPVKFDCSEAPAANTWHWPPKV